MEMNGFEGLASMPPWEGVAFASAVEIGAVITGMQR